MTRANSIRILPTLIIVAASAALFAINHVAWRGGKLDHVEGSRRMWEDFAVAQTRYHSSRPDPPLSVGDDPKVTRRMREFAPEWVQAEAIRPWEFWRTVTVPPRFRQPLLAPRETDDRGRSELLLASFRVFGGVAPMMMFWVGPLTALPLLAWLVVELALAGRILTAAFVGLGLASSPFLILALSLPYAAMGFYLSGVIALLALGVSAILGTSGLGRFFIRVILGGLAFALLIRCRSSVVFLAPAFALVVAVGVWRRTGALARGGRARTMLVALLLMFVPWVLFRPQGHHEVALGLWEGMGDFDRTKGHHWNDTVAKDFLETKGHPIPRTDAIWEYDNEDLFRQAVIEDITSDPAWYAGILVKRGLSTLGLTRLWTNAFRAVGPSEVTIGVYWAMAPPVNRVAIGKRSLDIWPPVLILLTIVAAALRPREDGVLLGIAIVGALGLPVIFTTASGVETQGIGLVYLVGSALAAGLLIDRAAGVRAVSSRHP